LATCQTASTRQRKAAILAAVHARVPMVTLDEQRAVKLENAKADMRLWASLQAVHAGAAEDRKRVIARAKATVASSRSAAFDAETKAQEANDRVERIERGEDVPGGLGEPVNVERVLRQAGMTASDLHNARLLHAVCDALGEMPSLSKWLGNR
jgi:hypothetical protein